MLVVLVEYRAGEVVFRVVNGLDDGAIIAGKIKERPGLSWGPELGEDVFDGAVFESMSEPSVSHSVRSMGVCRGTYASDAMPELTNAGVHTSVRERSSGFVKRRVMTSFSLRFALSQVFAVLR